MTRPWPPNESTRNYYLKKYTTPVASAVSTVCATLAVTPLENIKTRMQTHNFKNISQCMKYLWRTEGPRGYVAGALPPLASVTVVRVVNFTTYNASKRTISDAIFQATGFDALEHYAQPGSRPTIASVATFTAAGMLAGLASAPIACPFELAKNVVQTSVLVANRSQAAPDAAQDSTLRSKPRVGTFEAIGQIIHRHGVRGLYTGFHLHMIRDTIGTGLYFGIYETVKQVTASQIGQDKSPFGGPMIAGAICSTVPWFCTYPLDTRKTRAQSVLLGKNKEIGEASVAVAKSSMYRGLSIILMRTAVNNIILLSLYELITQKINNLEN
ncbi:Mitochondrial carrier protein [Aspergillus sclerotialis]|uniref:Mitochondrial carrier protein n=1 Tax=Aspergillus sclerotialis TaxID=2070753 RepID=A0A3A2ZQV0_9EURO|nr:Mitochondrial carrier protein [Aspergillus sclerotialis]